MVCYANSLPAIFSKTTIFAVLRILFQSTLGKPAISVFFMCFFLLLKKLKKTQNNSDFFNSTELGFCEFLQYWKRYSFAMIVIHIGHQLTQCKFLMMYWWRPAIMYENIFTGLNNCNYLRHFCTVTLKY